MQCIRRRFEELNQFPLDSPPNVFVSESYSHVAKRPKLRHIVPEQCREQCRREECEKGSNSPLESESEQIESHVSFAQLYGKRFAHSQSPSVSDVAMDCGGDQLHKKRRLSSPLTSQGATSSGADVLPRHDERGGAEMDGNIGKVESKFNGVEQNLRARVTHDPDATLTVKDTLRLVQEALALERRRHRAELENCKRMNHLLAQEFHANQDWSDSYIS